MIAALYVQKNGCYYGLPDVDPWDIERDARLYAGPWPVVAHPPCARWCQLAALVESRYPHCKRGEDGGCFAAALDAVRTYGGVLEHPAYSAAFAAHGLPRPHVAGWQRTICGGWVAQVERHRYGHRADKLTWLYAYGVEPPPLKWGRNRGASSVAVSSCANNLRKHQRREFMHAKERAATPPAFRDLLLSIARSARVQVAA